MGDVPPRDGDIMEYHGFPSIGDLEFSRRSWSSPFLLSSPTPPIPFLKQLYFSPTPSLRMGGVFFGLPYCSPFYQSALDLVILPAEPMSHGVRAVAG